MRYEAPVEDYIEDYLDGWSPEGRTRKTRFPKPNPPADRKISVQKTRPTLLASYEEMYQRRLAPINTQLDLLAETLTPLQQALLSLFIFKNGPQAVLRAVERDHSLNRDWYQNSPTLAIRHDMIRATGTVFERLAYLWLCHQNQEEDTLVLDPGSTARVDTALRRATSRSLDVDGMIFNSISSTPTLRALYEYKTNPEGPSGRGQLVRQIATTQYFVSTTGGRTFNVHVKADLPREILFRQITIPRKPMVALVIPNDRTTTWEDHPDITVRKAPFSSHLVTAIAFQCLKPAFYSKEVTS